MTKATVPALDELCRRVTFARAGAAPFLYQRRDDAYQAIEAYKLITLGGVTSWFGDCERCARKNWLQWSHFFSRAIKATRWDMDNVHALCYSCHIGWAHRRPASFDTWMRKRLGERAYDALVLRANTTNRRPDLGAVQLLLIGELRRLIGAAQGA